MPRRLGRKRNRKKAAEEAAAAAGTLPKITFASQTGDLTTASGQANGGLGAIVAMSPTPLPSTAEDALLPSLHTVGSSQLAGKSQRELDPDVLTNKQALARFVRLPMQPLTQPKHADERLELMRRVQHSLQTLHKHLKVSESSDTTAAPFPPH